MSCVCENMHERKENCEVKQILFPFFCLSARSQAEYDIIFHDIATRVEKHEFLPEIAKILFYFYRKCTQI